MTSPNSDSQAVPDAKISAAMAETSLLVNADVYCYEAVQGNIPVTAAVYRVYELLVNGFASPYPEEAKKSAFFATLFPSLHGAFTNIISHALPHDPKLENREWLGQHFDPHLRVLIEGPQSVPAFLEDLWKNRDSKVSKDVLQIWNLEAVRFHRENKGDCKANGGCPSTNCTAKELVTNARAKGLL